jgi:hypothetical protein
MKRCLPVALDKPGRISAVGDHDHDYVKRVSQAGIPQRARRSGCFLASHNVVFASCRRPFFCPLNPDVKLLNNPSVF